MAYITQTEEVNINYTATPDIVAPITQTEKDLETIPEAASIAVVDFSLLQGKCPEWIVVLKLMTIGLMDEALSRRASFTFLTISFLRIWLVKRPNG